MDKNLILATSFGFKLNSNPYARSAIGLETYASSAIGLVIYARSAIDLV